MIEQQALYAVKPVLIERQCGGWLAITPRGWPLSLGVEAETSADAQRKFSAALDRWSKLEDRNEEVRTEEARSRT